MLFDVIRQEILAQLKTALPTLTETELVLEIPPDPKMGDFAFPTFRLAKSLRKAPPVIAQEVFKALSANSTLQKFCSVTTAGPYVNFSVQKNTLTSDVLGELLLSGEELSHKKTQGKSANVTIEFSSPNVAKAFNIYHLRSTMIGNCLYRVFKARGFHPIAINHLGDWGTQYGTLALAYEKWGDEKELETRGIEYLVELYVRINKEMESDPALADKAREYFARLEKGDAKITAAWKRFCDLSITEFKRMYERLNVHFDHYWGESKYVPMVEELVEKPLEQKGLLVESEGAQVVNLDAFGMPPCIVRKQDGSTIYHTRDLAAAIYRYNQFHFDRSVYVVGGEQKLHFAQVFKTLELMGFEWAKRCVHIGFGLYRFKDQKMSTRKGNFITMESVLDQAVERVREIMNAKAEQGTQASAILSLEERAEASEIIGVGAIVFNDLSTDRNSDVNFDLDAVLDFEGETGPYILYAHTRCLSILRNAPAALASADPQVLLKAAGTKLMEAEELDLIRMLAKLPIVLDSVLEFYKPSLLASYLIDVTKVFNVFYRAHKVLVDDTELAQARLALVLATQRTLHKGLNLLGMRVPKRM